MKIGILGTGSVGKTIAARLAELGHEVTMGTRDPALTIANTQPDRSGFPPMAEWLQLNDRVRLGSFDEAAAHAELIINATSGVGSLDALRAAGAANIGSKVLIDISNPLDFSHGMPPTLSVVNNDSLGEQIQREFPDARVVKTLNTTTARVMANPGELAWGDHSIFVCGNDVDAKQTVRTLLESFGWRDILDTGDITNARAAEMVLPMWLSLMGSLGTPIFNFKIVR